MKTHLLTALYLLLVLSGWAACVLLIPVTMIGSLVGFLTMLIFMVLGVRRLPPLWIDTMMVVLSGLGMLFLFIVMSVLLFLVAYGKYFN